mgnify:FL=1
MTGGWISRVKNERGAAAFTYVFMLVLLLAVVVPLILTLLANSALDVLTSRNERLAERLALGGMESVFAYLRDYAEDSGVDRGAYLEDYPGFVEWSYETPENVPVRYKAEISPEAQGRYIVTVEVEAGAGTAKRKKTVEYLFAPTMGTADPHVVTDDSQRMVVPAGNGTMYVGGSYDEPSILNVDPTNLEQLSEAIGAAIAYYQDNAYDDYGGWIDAYLPIAAQAACTGNCVSDPVWENWAANMPDPPVLRIPSDNYWDAVDVTFGSPSNPVVLILENKPTFNNLTMTVYGTVLFPQGVTSNGFNLTVYGNIAFGASISPTTVFNVTTHKLNGEGGNFYVLGEFTPTNAPNLNIAGNFYADDVRLSNASRINIGGKMIVESELRFQNTMIQFNVGQDLLIGSLYTCCTNRIDTGGDLLIEGSITRSNPLELHSGGYIGVGGSIAAAPWHPIYVESGGGTTSLIVPSGPDGGGSGGSEGGGSPGNWNPVRVG